MIDALNMKIPVNTHLPNAAELKAGKEFEAVMLTGFIETMLPQNIGGTEAPHAGADVWRSFMARAVADQLASQNVTGVGTMTAQQLMQHRESIGPNA